MANVFISYERSAEGLARKAGDALIAVGHTVWSDADLPPHRPYAEVIQERLAAADAVLVLWSAAAARSQWVRAEAEHARHDGKLVQLTLDGGLPPMPFNQIQCAQLPGWTGDRHAPGWLKVLASLDQMSNVEGRIAQPPPSSPVKTGPRLPQARPAWIYAAATGAVVVIGAVGAFTFLGHEEAPAKQGRVAILPIEVLNDTPQARDIAEGLGDQLLATFNSNEIPAVPREDAMTLRGPDSLARMKAIGVSLVLGGSVRDDGKSIDIKLRLDDPAHHATLWTGGATGDAASAASLQWEVARTTAALLACANRALKPGGLSDPALLGRYLHACDIFVNNGDANGTANVFQLLGDLRTVIQGAPDFVPARTDLAKFEVYLAPTMPPETAATMRRDAVTMADEALRLQPKAPDAYLAKEMAMAPTDWAEREVMLRKGVAADPDWPHTNGFLAFFLQETGRVQDAKLFGARAAAADLQIDWRTWGAAMSCDAGDYEPSTSDAEDQLKKQPGDRFAKATLRTCLIDAKRFADARRLDPESISADPGAADPNLRIRVFMALQTRSPADREAARQAALMAARLDDDHLVYAIQMLSLLGDVDDAFALTGQVTAGYPDAGNLTSFLFWPPTEALRRDPRFIRLATRLKLARFWKVSGKWPDFCAEPDLPYNCRVEVEKILKL